MEILWNKIHFYVSTDTPKVPKFLAWHLGSSITFMILFYNSQNAPCGSVFQESLTGASFGCPHSVQSLTTALGM